MQGGATIPDVPLSDPGGHGGGGAALKNESCLQPLPPLGGRLGLVNIGNTCFLNAALQARPPLSESLDCVTRCNTCCSLFFT